MTSASLSLSNRISNHKKYITRTLWSSMLGFVLMAIYYVLGTAFMVARSINYGRVFHQSPERIKMEKINAAFRVLGMEQLGWILEFYSKLQKTVRLLLLFHRELLLLQPR